MALSSVSFVGRTQPLLGRQASAQASSSGPQLAVRCDAGAQKASKEVVIPNWTPPEPKVFSIRSDQYASMMSGALAATVRLGTGALAEGWKPAFVKDEDRDPKAKYSIVRAFGYKLDETSALYDTKRPAEPLVLYEFESCPFCRKAREGINVLGLPALIYPTSDRSDGATHRAAAQKMADEAGLTGRQRFPMLHDPNTGKTMYESDDILSYIWAEYGPAGGEVALPLRLGPITAITCGFASLARLGNGGKYEEGAKTAEQPLEVWGYEASPFCKPVREKLSSLGLAHVYHTTPRGSPVRDEFMAKNGRFQVPYLEDPNTGVKMFESAEIVEYLDAQYGNGTVISVVV